FPKLRPYAMVVACVTVAPIISKVQMVTALMAFATLLSVALGYAAFLLLLRFVETGRLKRVALGLSVPILALGTLVQEYALAVVMVMIFVFWSYARRATDPETRGRAWRAIFSATLAAGVAYGIFFATADFAARPGGPTASPFFALGRDLARLPLNLVE